MKITFVSHSAKLGGAEISLCELVAGLKRLGAAEATVILPHGGPLAERLEGAGATVVRLSNYGWATIRPTRLPVLVMAALDVASVLRLSVRFARHRPDLVVTNSLINPSGALAARMVGVRHLWLVNEFGDLDHDYRFLLGLPRTLAAVGRLSFAILACSRAVGDRMKVYVPPEKVAFAYYAIAMEPGRSPAQASSGGRSLRLLLLGKKHEGKGQLDQPSWVPSTRAVGSRLMPMRGRRRKSARNER